MSDSKDNYDLEPDDNESMTTLVATNQTNEQQSTASIVQAQSKEIAELKNQLDEVRTSLMITETTKQDEIDELKFRSKQEIDSLNHIIDALQTDLNGLRSDYDLLKNNFKEFKKHNNHHLPQSSINTSTSPISSKTANSNSSPALTNSQQIENENLEEDMRKAKESADMLRSVVLPLETEITTLRSRSNTSELKIKELELIINEKDQERKSMLDEEYKIISECLSVPVESDLEQLSKQLKTVDNLESNDYFKKYIQLKKYLKKTESKFVDLEQSNLKAIRQVYSLLSNEQKMRLIPNRSKKSKIVSKQPEDNEEDEFSIKQNETITRIEELITNLTLNNEDSVSIDTNVSTQTSSSSSSILPGSITYAELLAMFEKEKLACIDMETNFQQQAKDSNKQIESLTQEMNNLATIIDDLRKQYLNMQVQYQFQLDTLIKLNEDIRNELQQSEFRNEMFKNENLKLKAENKQFQGEQTMLLKDFDEQYHVAQNLDEAQRQLSSLRNEIVRLYQANQALHRQHNISLESIKHLQKSNMNYQRSTTGSSDDHAVMIQSLESELERERKVRVEAENDLKEFKTQLKLVKEKSQTIVESLRQKNEQNDFEMRKLKDDNQELSNQIQSLKKESKNSLSVQEDLVRLIQSLQIELNQTKQASGSDSSSNGTNSTSIIVVRCQHEDDFNECAACKNQFSVARRKNRCKHCCKIFCADCCAKSVLSGPNLRPHKVCESCHTLLDKDLKPASNSISTN